VVSPGRVNDDASSLVDDQQVVVLENHDRNGRPVAAGGGAVRRRTRNIDLELLSARQDLGLAGRAVVDRDGAFADPAARLCARAGVVGEVAVESEARSLSWNYDFHREP
jgi:hypothetical protein